ncbi:MAG: hypothetical protein HY062_08365 [Bacteroidetes bacterium]|nr:hypothetical protein [Bacteroidota bacterium]
MSTYELNDFVNLIKSMFSEKENGSISIDTDLKTLKEWSSLQNMILVTELDKVYNVIVTIEDFNNSKTLKELFEVIVAKKN